MMSMIGSVRREPFVGPRVLDADDHDLFYGRGGECKELRSMLRSHRIVVLHGRAGCGKSSLLRAGLCPELGSDTDVLATGRVSGRSAYPQAALPDHNPLTLALLRSWSPEDPPSSLAQMSLTEFLRERAHASERPSRAPMIVAVVDQLEEIFSGPAQPQFRDDFFADIASAVRTVPRLRVILAVRTDALRSLEQYQHVIDVPRCDMGIGGLRRGAAIEAVQGPMKRAGVWLADDLAAELVDDLSDPIGTARGPGEETGEIEPAQLQAACRHLYRALQPQVVITSDFVDVHGLADKALAEFCADVLAETAIRHELSLAALTRWVQIAFVSADGTRAFVPEAHPATAGMPNSIVRGLLAGHLLTAVDSSGRRYALASDRLLPAIAMIGRRTLPDDGAEIDAAEYLRLAVAVLADGELKLAQRHAWHALRATDRGNLRLQADSRSLLGNIAFERGQFELAEQQYLLAAQLSELRQDHAAVGRLLGAIGRIHAKQGRYNAALEDLQAAVTRLPGEITLQTELAKVLWHVGQPQAASAVFGSVLTVEPDYAEALAGRGQVRAEHGNAASALDDLQALRRLRPSMGDQPEVRSAYALALARSGRPESAMQEANAAMASAPDNGLIYLRAAMVASATGAPERATALLRKAEAATGPALSSEQRNEARRLMDSVSEPKD